MRLGKNIEICGLNIKVLRRWKLLSNSTLELSTISSARPLSPTPREGLVLGCEFNAEGARPFFIGAILSLLALSLL